MRLPVHERKLDRAWRRVVELEPPVEKDFVGGNLLRKVVSEVQVLRSEGLLQGDFSDFLLCGNV